MLNISLLLIINISMRLDKNLISKNKEKRKHSTQPLMWYFSIFMFIFILKGQYTLINNNI